jgi:MoxR-like ATPase
LEGQLEENHKVADLYEKIRGEISKVIVGKGDIELALMLAIVAGGHVLIEGMPGTAKTKLAQTFAEVIGGNFKRIQFTPDMMPADVTGFFVYSPDGASRFIQGPIFSHIVLADELNRTTPRTQSALLEAMQESHVTIEGKLYPLRKPFMVIATQVPAGSEGTYVLTDVQLDRFLLMANSQYVSVEEEQKIVSSIDVIDQGDIKAVTDLDEISILQDLVKKVHVAPSIVEYIVAITTLIRKDPDVSWGPSTRASIALYKCARVMALIDGREFVIPDDVKNLAFKAIEHRLRVKPESEMDNITPRIIIERSLEKITAPKLNL